MGEHGPLRRRRDTRRGATLWVMSTLPIPPELLARLLDYDEEDERSSETHFDRMEEVFATLDSTANRLGLAQAFWEEPEEAVRALGFDLLAVQAHRFDWHVQPLIEAADAIALEGAGRAGLKLRRAAANALACIVDDARVLGPLLRFALDEDSVVRDWAAFALGVRENDNPELRDALARLLFDADDDTAAEAAYALALRKDRRVLPVLERVLEQPNVGRLYFEAAAALGDPALLPTLRRLRERGEDADLDRTIVACGG